MTVDDQLPPYRIGEGSDVHALVRGRPLVIGGVPIPHTHGLLGHSDADVLLHAICDAVLGAAALGDIGTLFPDNDSRFKGADSQQLLSAAMASVHQAGWQVVNLDSTVLAERPRLAPHRAAMEQNIARLLAVTPERVNVKAKTGERLGPVGQANAIAATASVLLCRRQRI